MPKESLTDSELVDAIIKDDEKAFNQLFERYWSNVYAVAFKYVKDRENCLEITHDIFLNIWRKRHELHIRSFKSYVITAASYHGIRRAQTLKAIPLSYVEDYSYTEDKTNSNNLGSAINSGEAAIFKNELDVKVDRLLDDLPKRSREIYVMSRKQNLSITEIAEQLQISKRTVENQLSSALKHLRDSLKLIALIVIAMYF
jgi:RNA polymerase sigma-70 factor (family 1)